MRARKSKYNTELEFEDFILKEFSKDKEVFVAALELSCCDCVENEDLHNQKDSPCSFLVKFKADQLSDPSAIKGGVAGFVLPDNMQYRFAEVESFFSSIRSNHYSLILNDTELQKLAKNIYQNHTAKKINFTHKQVDEYLYKSYQQAAWATLLANARKTKWKKYIKRVLLNMYDAIYGKIEPQAVKEAYKIDPTGFKELLAEMKKMGCLRSKELKMISGLAGE